jgi:hypothetical protein
LSLVATEVPETLNTVIWVSQGNERPALANVSGDPGDHCFSSQSQQRGLPPSRRLKAPWFQIDPGERGKRLDAGDI